MTKKACLALLFNAQGEVLSVSRKNDPNDLGLPGGKQEPEDVDDSATAIRETWQETGLNITNLRPFFTCNDGQGYEVITFLADWSGSISTSERGIVKWVQPERLTKGTFGPYNTLLIKKLRETHG